MALESELIKQLENRLIAIQAKKKISIEKGSLELFFAFDQEELNLVEKILELRGAFNEQGKLHELKRRLLAEIGKDEKTMFEQHSKEWLARERKESRLSDLEFGKLEGRLEMIEKVKAILTDQK